VEGLLRNGCGGGVADRTVVEELLWTEMLTGQMWRGWLRNSCRRERG
jgi:hypothetical protein